MKILHLTLKKKWFDLILSGMKTDEFREYKPYWGKRLVDDCGYGKHFDIVRFKNGYGNNVPVMDVEFKGISFTGPEWFTPKCGEVLWPDTIKIKLGKVLNYNQQIHPTEPTPANSQRGRRV
ncbi:MAG: ASCH domain-containing protein [Proteobacteria bacterium]|nr:ASCH domain-containing protein [Pseudomonadota bacterium]MBU4471595.1 ASCH domain-containing protein [Pseudomonadota bacterium]MCG2752602.1 ASCH domain-containing protein [Desulfobacteraceae bacterium]